MKFVGGCNGNTKGIASLVRGMKVDDVIERCKGIRCGLKSTSCPDQLAEALRLAKETGFQRLSVPFERYGVKLLIKLGIQQNISEMYFPSWLHKIYMLLPVSIGSADGSRIFFCIVMILRRFCDPVETAALAVKNGVGT